MKTLTVQLPFDQDLNQYLKKEFSWIKDYKILSKSLDARKAPLGKKPQYHYQIVALAEGEKFATESEKFSPIKFDSMQRPIIVGSGPAGLFCALRLAEYGISSIILERGEAVKERMQKISKYWRYGELDIESNVCFGEGGAGLYSDGKLITRVKSDYINYVMQKMVSFGAPEEIAYLANPHLGSNKIRALIGEITQHLQSIGCEIRYNTKVTDLIFDEKKQTQGVVIASGEKIYSKNVVLATGHSAKDIYHVLERHGVLMQPKDFAVGVRIEHKRQYIDYLQHAEFADDAKLGAARYRLSYHDAESERGTYSFCMCPGGYVLASSTDEQGIVTNGMSNNTCNSAWSNAALVVTVKTQQDCAVEKYGVMAGLHFMEEIEQKAYQWSKQYASGREIPAQRIEDFLQDKMSQEFPKTSTPSKLVSADLRAILPEFIIEHLKQAVQKFDENISGFAKDAILMAPETRTSAPVTIKRNAHDFTSLSHAGLYPAGEGAGYAGGITSAAVDGIKIAEAIKEKLSN